MERSQARNMQKAAAEVSGVHPQQPGPGKLHRYLGTSDYYNIEGEATCRLHQEPLNAENRDRNYCLLLYDVVSTSPLLFLGGGNILRYASSLD